MNNHNIPPTKSSTDRQPAKRVGMVIEIRPECIDDYRELHADRNSGVRNLLTKYHLHNFSIFLHEVGGRWLEFGYYEYTGDDFVVDMAKLDAEPQNQEWLALCNPMQNPLDGGSGWSVMERIYFNH